MAEPAREEQARAAELHSRMLARDPTAPADLCERYLIAITARLGRRFPNVDEHKIEDAAADALLNYAEHPERFDPARSPLAAYLYMSARGDLLNWLEQEKRRRKRLVPLDDVELARSARNTDVTGICSAEAALGEESLAELQSVLDAACRTEQERRVLRLVAEGERRTAVFAQVLGIADLGIAEQRREVKRVKERLLKKARRLASQGSRRGQTR